MRHTKITAIFLFLFFLVGTYAVAQNAIGSVKELDSKVKETATTLKNTISTVIGICFALGACYLIYAFVTGNERAGRYAMLYFAALVVFGILKMINVL